MNAPPDVRVPRTRRRATGVAVAAAAVVALLGAGVRVDFAPQMDLDAAVSEAVYAGDDRAPLLGGLLEVLTAPGSWVFRLAVFLPVVTWLFLTRAWRAFVWVLPAVLLIGLVTTLLKEFFGRVRPDFEGGGARYESLSYPSGHSSGIATLVTVSLLLAWPYLSRTGRRWAAAGGALLALVVGLTRMWLGVHFLSDVVGGWALGLAWSLAVALTLGGWPPHRLPPRVRRVDVAGREVSRPPGGPARGDTPATALDQHVVLAADDGSLGPLLRVADDRLPPGTGYGRHAHRGVDVVAVVLSGTLHHDWADGASLVAGDVAVLQAGAGLDHDERAGDGGARVLQCYLRGTDAAAPPSHAVHRSAQGWVDLGRVDARLWLTRLDTGGSVELPEGLAVVADPSGARAVAGSPSGPGWHRDEPSGRTVTADRPLTVLVWQLDTTRPAWAI